MLSFIDIEVLIPLLKSIGIVVDGADATLSDTEKKAAINTYLDEHYTQWVLITQLAANIQQEDFQSKKARASCVATLKDTLLTAAIETDGLDFHALLGKVSPKVAAEIKMTAQQKQTCRYMFEVDYDLYCLYRDSVKINSGEEEPIQAERVPNYVGKKWARMQAKEKLERKIEAIHATWAELQASEESPANAINQKQTAQLVVELKQHDSAFWNPSTGFYELDGPIFSSLMASIDESVVVPKKTRSSTTRKATLKAEDEEQATEEEQVDAETLSALKDLTISTVANMANHTALIDRKELETKVLDEMALPVPQPVIRRFSIFMRRFVKLMEAQRAQLLKDERLSSDETEATDIVSEALLRAGTI